MINSEVINWISKYTWTPQNSFKFRTIFRKSFFPSSAVYDWLWDCWWLSIVLPAQIIIRGNNKIHNKISILLNKQLFSTVKFFGLVMCFNNLVSFWTLCPLSHVWDKLLKQSPTPKNLDIPSENDLIRKCYWPIINLKQLSFGRKASWKHY